MAFNYSKKTLRNFFKPKNFGKIKNPDARGRVGNPACGDIMELELKVDKKTNKIKDIKFRTFGCLHPKEKVNTPSGWKEISKLKKNQIVYNKNYKEAKIKDFYKGDFNGELYHIIPFISKFNSFLVTPSHPVLCIKRNLMKKKRKSSKKSDWLRLDKKELLKTKPYYLEAEYLEKGDYILFQKFKEVKNKKIYTKDLMRLIGYYLSEGYITSKGHTLNFAFNKNEKEYIEETKKIIKKVTGKKGNHRIRKNVCEIYVCSKKWCNFFEKNCNKIAKDKRLSEEIMLLPFNKQWEMIKTYINGDGNIYKRRKNDSKTYRADTSSKELAIQLQQILSKGNIISSIKIFNRPETKIEGRILKPHTLFNISFKLDKKHSFAKQTEKYFLIPIKKIEYKRFKGKVYNIEVSGKDHSYLTKGFAIHNCAAAIASTSMLTQLAKGKTIEQAEKLTMKDVKDKLDDLPKIKIHCSTMAIQALKKAIEDYKKNKKNKPSLEKIKN
jgi:nitrogen fixation protein NifU and related proteins